MPGLKGGSYFMIKDDVLWCYLLMVIAIPAILHVLEPFPLIKIMFSTLVIIVALVYLYHIFSDYGKLKQK